MGRNSLLECVVLLILAIGSLHAYEIVGVPSDTVVMAGDSVTLNCTVVDTGSTEFVEWTEFVTSPQGVRISLNENVQHANASKYEIVGEFNLRLKQTTIYDGGMYGCRLLLGSQSQYNTAQLMVFERPQCEATPEVLYEGDSAQVSCHLSYGSNTRPSVYFSDRDSNMPNTTDYGANFVHVASNITNVTWQHDKKPFTCHVTADDHMDNCTAMLNIRYSARNSTMMPVSNAPEIGQEFHCSANGNPAPQITWEQISPPEGGRIQGSVLIVTSAMVGTDQEWRCMAKNTVLGQEYQSHTTHVFTAIERPASSASTVTLLGALLTLTLTLFLHTL